MFRLRIPITMTNYARRNASTGAGKKYEQLRYWEEEMLLRIESARPERDISQAAENVRHAQLQVFKAILHDIEPARIEDLSVRLQEKITHLWEKTAYWKRLTIEEIIKLYSKI